MRPLIFLVHVPKTAGSTVNKYLQEHVPGGLLQCNRLFTDELAKLPKVAETAPWLSAHIDFTTAEEKLRAATDRPVRFFTCIRTPKQQVMSHYNWLIEIYHKGGDFYRRHTDRAKAISEKIRNSSHNVDQIINNLKQFSDLFLNVQSRYILGKGFDWNSGQLIQQLDKYEMIVDSPNVDKLLSRMLGQPITMPRRENVSPYHFDKAAFDHPRMRDFLRRFNTLDELVYRAAVAEAPREPALADVTTPQAA